MSWLLILWVTYGPVVVPDIATKAECDRVAHVVFHMKTSEENEKDGWLRRSDESYSCERYTHGEKK